MREGCPVGCTAPVPGTCRTGTCQQGISYSTGCFAPCQPCFTAHCSGYARTRVPAGRFGLAGAVTLAVSPEQSFSVPSLRWWEVLND